MRHGKWGQVIQNPPGSREKRGLTGRRGVGFSAGGATGDGAFEYAFEIGDELGVSQRSAGAFRSANRLFGLA